MVGTGSIRLCLLRNLSKTHKILIASGTLIADASIRFLNNTINDTNYIKSHIKTCQTIRSEDNALIVKIDPTTEQAVMNAETSGHNSKFSPGNAPKTEGGFV